MPDRKVELKELLETMLSEGYKLGDIFSTISLVMRDLQFNTSKQ